jgi:DNA-binding transcriptional ArsR family regulator
MDESESRSAASTEHLLVKAMSHPSRARLLMEITDRPGHSAQELAERRGQPVRTIRHHLSELRKAGLIETVETKTRRGTLELFYRSIVPPLIETDEFAELNSAEKLRTTTEILKRSYETASLALSRGTFDARDDRGLVNVQAEVDPQGWQEIVDAHRRAYEEVERVKAESAERLASSEEDPIRVASTLMWFELPRA